MAKVTKKQADEREYIIPLRKEIAKVPRYKKTPKAVKAVKQFIAKHMRIPDRDVSKVKLSKWVNQELWFRGIKNPITKIKVKVKRDGENIQVELVDFADKMKFAKAREDKKKETEKQIKDRKKAEDEAKKKAEEDKKKDEKQSDEEKKEEDEKEKSVADAGKQAAQQQAKQEKHTAQLPKGPKTSPQRKALAK